MMKLGPRQKKWLEALESGDYQQTKRYLRDDNEGFCCLGVACDLFDSEKWTTAQGEYGGECFFYKYTDAFGDEQYESELLVSEVQEYYGFGNDTGAPLENMDGIYELTEMNDRGISFGEIAAHVRDNAYLYFRESK